MIIVPGRHKGVNKVVIWDGMIGNELIGPFLVLEVLKLSAEMSYAFLENSLEPWLDNLSLVRLKKIIIGNCFSPTLKITIHSHCFVFFNFNVPILPHSQALFTHSLQTTYYITCAILIFILSIILTCNPITRILSVPVKTGVQFYLYMQNANFKMVC